MPRKAPDGNAVIEHRITLGNYERQELKEYLDSQKTANYLAPFAGAIGPVAGVAAVGSIGYLVAAYIFEWWPFKGPDYATGFAFTDRFYYEAFTELSSDEKIGEARDEKLAALDKSKEMAEKIMTNEAELSKTVWGRMQLRAAQNIIDNYDKQRQDIIERYAKIQQAFAERAQNIAESSDAV